MNQKNNVFNDKPGTSYTVSTRYEGAWKHFNPNASHSLSTTVTRPDFRSTPKTSKVLK